MYKSWEDIKNMLKKTDWSAVVAKALTDFIFLTVKIGVGLLILKYIFGIDILGVFR